MILTGFIDRLHRINHDLIVELQAPGNDVAKIALAEKIAEAKDIISKASALKYQMGSNKELE